MSLPKVQPQKLKVAAPMSSAKSEKGQQQNAIASAKGASLASKTSQRQCHLQKRKWPAAKCHRPRGRSITGMLNVFFFFFFGHSGCCFPLLLLGCNPLALVTPLFFSPSYTISSGRSKQRETAEKELGTMIRKHSNHSSPAKKNPGHVLERLLPLASKEPCRDPSESSHTARSK